MVTGDEEVGVIDGLWAALALNTSLVDELSLLIGVYEYQLEERKDLEEEEEQVSLDRQTSSSQRRKASLILVHAREVPGRHGR